MPTKTLTTNAALYVQGALAPGKHTVQIRTGDPLSPDHVLLNGSPVNLTDCEIRDGHIGCDAGWTAVWDPEAEKTSLVLTCTKDQKSAYVRASAGRKLTDWCLEKLDAAVQAQLVNAAADLAMQQQKYCLDEPLGDRSVDTLDELARAVGYASIRAAINEHELWGCTVGEAIEHLREFGTRPGGI